MWRPLVDGEFSFQQFVTINALPLLECSLGKSQWTVVTLFSVMPTMFRLVRAKFKQSWRPWLGVTMSTWRPRVSQSDQTVCMPLEFWTGVTAAFHTCNWCELRGTVWRMQETSGASTSNTPRHPIPFPRKARCPCRWHVGTKNLRHQHRQSP